MLEGQRSPRACSPAAPRSKAIQPCPPQEGAEGLDDVSVGGFRVHFAEDRVASRLVELSLTGLQGKVRE